MEIKNKTTEFTSKEDINLIALDDITLKLQKFQQLKMPAEKYLRGKLILKLLTTHFMKANRQPFPGFLRTPP